MGTSTLGSKAELGWQMQRDKYNSSGVLHGDERYSAKLAPQQRRLTSSRAIRSPLLSSTATPPDPVCTSCRSEATSASPIAAVRTTATACPPRRGGKKPPPAFRIAISRTAAGGNS